MPALASPARFWRGEVLDTYDKIREKESKGKVAQPYAFGLFYWLDDQKDERLGWDSIQVSTAISEL